MAGHDADGIPESALSPCNGIASPRKEARTQWTFSYASNNISAKNAMMIPGGREDSQT